MDSERRLLLWFAAQMADVHDVRIEGLDRVVRGHSAETFVLTLCWTASNGDERRDVVIRVRPPTPGLLEPYDLRRQYEILRALAPTPVRAPRALWFEPTGEVLGAEFYVMERLPGRVYEQGFPEELARDPALVRRMCESMVEQIAAVHAVDLRATGLNATSDGRGYVDRELEHWFGEIRRTQRGPLPALDRLMAALREQQPEQCPTITLVHGDAKPGNFAFEGGKVTAVFDWEMATVGDPLADVGWAEVLWTAPGSFTSVAGGMSADEFVALWERLTGIGARHRPWYKAFQALKMAAILAVAGHLFDAGHSDDLRFVHMATMVHPLTLAALHELGIDEPLEPGALLPREERIREVKEALST
ncbi:MAG: phosphotransferase family protein [Acidimicrobiales bacterium]